MFAAKLPKRVSGDQHRDLEPMLSPWPRVTKTKTFRGPHTPLQLMPILLTTQNLRTPKPKKLEAPGAPLTRCTWSSVEASGAGTATGKGDVASQMPRGLGQGRGRWRIFEGGKVKGLELKALGAGQSCAPKQVPHPQTDLYGLWVVSLGIESTNTY